MKTQAAKIPGNKSQAVAHTVAQKQRSGLPAIQLTDNRPEAMERRKLQEDINNSSRTQQLKAYRAMADQSPQVQRLKTYQAMADHYATQQKPGSSLQVTQLYAAADGGGKISAGRTLLVKSPFSAFAAPAKFQEANGIPGQVAFDPGAPASAPYADLNEILPVIRAGSQLGQDTAQFDVTTQGGDLKQKARAGYYPDKYAISNGIMEAMQEHYGDSDEWNNNEEIMRFFGTTDYGDIEELVEPLAELIAELLPAFGNYSESGIEERIDGYMQQQIFDWPRLLMPSDCALMAKAIAGDTPGSENPRMAPGNVYGKTQNIANRDKAEWEYHFAAIIMTDGDDHITMENAAAKNSEKFGKARFDKTWFFEMYGAGEGQSFGDKYNRDLGH